MKRTEISAIRNLLGSFSLLFGAFGVKNGRRGRSMSYCGENICDQLFICIFFFFDTLVIMGDTERPRFTGFHGLSVCGITTLQCIMNAYSSYYYHFSFGSDMTN